MRRLPAALLVLLLAVPASAGDRGAQKTVLQTLGGASAGLGLGTATALAGIFMVLDETDNRHYDAGVGLLIASPIVFAAAEAGAVHLIGRHYDGKRARFWPTFGGAVLGTAAGIAIWQSHEQSGKAFALGVGVATAGTLAGYSLGRGAVNVDEHRLALGVPVVSPRAARGPDGRAHFGADVRLLDVRF